MAHSASNGGRFDVRCSRSIATRLKRIQRQAKTQGRGEQVLSAIRTIYHWLSHDPIEFGEPLYRLPSLRLQVRHGVIRPLLIDFAVHEVQPLVFIKGVTLLSQETNE